MTLGGVGRAHPPHEPAPGGCRAHRNERLDVNQTMRRRIAALVCAAVVGLAPSAALAEGDSVANEAGIGALAAVGTLVYGPVKIVYAALGLVFGGAAWGLSGGDSDVLDAVITPSVRGDYVLTPEHIRMERDIEFMGRDPEYRFPQTAMLDDEEPLSYE